MLAADRPLDFDATADHRSAQVVQIESSKVLPIIVILALLSGVAIALAMLAWARASDSERETRMLEYYLLELDAKAIAAGIKRPEEAIANKLKGSGGNS